VAHIGLSGKVAFPFPLFTQMFHGPCRATSKP
jgi:hypothetical protein